jgi:16S rRNA processing protein RimM
VAAGGDGGFADRRRKAGACDGAKGAELELGSIGRPHGVHGEVTVTLTTDRPERTTPGAVLYAGDRKLVVESARPHQGRWLVRFEGVADRDAAEALRGATLVGEALDDRGEGRVWVHELVGAEARDVHGNLLGRVIAVETNPAHDLLVLDDGALIPIVFVVDQEPGVVIVDVPNGLLDVNR